jgi:hypothetical protein
MKPRDIFLSVFNGLVIKAGDSGSFALNENGAVADVWDRCNHVGVALTMPDIIDSMKSRLDASIPLYIP